MLVFWKILYTYYMDNPFSNSTIITQEKFVDCVLLTLLLPPFVNLVRVLDQRRLFEEFWTVAVVL